MAWQKPTNVKEWFSIVVRHKKKFFFPAVLVMIAFVVQGFYAERVYTAGAIFERYTDPTLNRGVGAQEIRENFGRIQRLMYENVRGRDAVEQLIDDLQLAQNLPHTPDGELTPAGLVQKLALIEEIQRGVRIHTTMNTGGTERIKISFTSSDRELAPRVANQMVENYVRKVRQEMDQLLLTANRFFEQEAARYSAQSIELMAKKLAFEEKHPGLRPDDPKSVGNQINAATADLEKTDNTLAETKQRIEAMKMQIEEMPDLIEVVHTTTNPELLSLRERLQKLTTELAYNKEEMRRTDEHPTVINLRNAIAKTEARIVEVQAEAEEVVSGKELAPNEAKLTAQDDVQRFEADLLVLGTRREALMKKLDQLELLRNNFWNIRKEYLQLANAVKEAETQLKFWEDNLRRTRLAMTHEVGQQGIRLSIYERAPKVAKPSSPKWDRIVGFALAAGIGIGLMFVVLAELFDHSFHTVDQAVNELKLPVLGAVDEIVTPSEAFRRRLVSWGLFPALGVFLVLVLIGSVALLVLSLEDPEQFTMLQKQPVQFVKQTLGVR